LSQTRVVCSSIVRLPSLAASDRGCGIIAIVGAAADAGLVESVVQEICVNSRATAKSRGFIVHEVYNNFTTQGEWIVSLHTAI
jgi:hypothetical protein